MKNKSLLNQILAFLALVFFNACETIPEGAKAVKPFEVNKYLGTWYEIARMDFKFERDLKNVTATYTLNEDGTIKVLNQGFNINTNERKQAEGKAKFVDLTDEAKFMDLLSQKIGQSDEKDVLLFIHGFNVTFEEAMLRAAQLGYDLNFKGGVAAFTWPSLGSVGGYIADQDSAVYSRNFLSEFIKLLIKPGTKKLHILANNGNKSKNACVTFQCCQFLASTQNPINKDLRGQAFNLSKQSVFTRQITAVPPNFSYAKWISFACFT